MNNRAQSSIRRRLLLTTLPFVLLFLLLAASGVDRAYQRAASQSESQKLQLQLWSLMADAEVQGQNLVMPPNLQEPRFDQPESTLYGFAFTANGDMLWQSRSVQLSGASPASEYSSILRPLRQGQTLFEQLDSGEFLLRQAVTYIDEQNTAFNLTFMVLESGADYRASLAEFRQSLSIWLALAGISLLVLQLSLLFWGLSPLSRLAKEVDQLQSGELELLQHNYPTEIAVVTDNLNQLLTSYRSQRERYRNTLGDLAHSLKTPLTALRTMIEIRQKQSSGSSGNTPNGSGPDENESVIAAEEGASLLHQIDRMDEIVARQLGRVAMTDGQKLTREVVNLKALLERLLSALATVYSARQLAIETQLDAQLTVHAEQGDLMEAFGNLLDNAFKYANGRVFISLDSTGAAGSTSVKVTIEDDGPGIQKTQRNVVMQRGVRLDTRREGQGFGMAMSAEIIDAYGGELSIDDSELGGACVCIELPVSS